MSTKMDPRMQKAIDNLPCKATLVAWHSKETHLDVVLMRCDKSGDYPAGMDKKLHHPGFFANGRSAIEFVVWWYNRDSNGFGSGLYHSTRSYDSEPLALAYAAMDFSKRCGLHMDVLNADLGHFTKERW